MSVKNIKTPLTDEDVMLLKAGDRVLITGTLYTARDEAHKKIVALIKAGKDLPINLEGQIIYYAGPSPAGPGRVIGAIGPTTSGRMDSYTPLLLGRGVKATIGKGSRSKEVRESMAENKAVYFAATGGAAALLAGTVKKATVAAYPELGPEAIYCLEVENFPATVVNDAFGGDVYEKGRRKYCRI